MLYCGHVYVVLWETAKFVQLYLFTNHVWGIQFLHIITSIWYFEHFFFIVAIQIGIWWYLIVILIHVFLMANDVASLVCLFAICMSFLVKHLFISFAHFPTRLFVSLLLSLEILYIF